MDAATSEPSRAGRPRVLGRRMRGRAHDVAIGLGPAVAAGYALQTQSTLVTPLFGAIAAISIFAIVPLAAVALGAALPISIDLPGGPLSAPGAPRDILLSILVVR